jgi:MinD superfamily P-loop ATPase
VPYADADTQRAYKRAWALERNKEKRDWVNKDKLAKGCRVCGYNTNPHALQYHHTKGGKLDTVANLVLRKIGLEQVRTEVEKCEVLCANCHAEMHHPYG